MNAHVNCGLSALLLVIACNRPDDGALFSDIGSLGSSGGSAAHPAAGSTSGSVAGGGQGASSTGGVAATGSGAEGPGDDSDAGAAGESGAPSVPDGGGGMAQAGSSGASSGGSGGSAAPEPPAPVCGNGKLESGEQCDDGGLESALGCVNCQVDCRAFGEGTLASDDHHCYNGYDQANFEGAQADCVRRGGHLATISSEAENEIARHFVRGSKWIGGLEDVARTSPGTGAYEWLTGEPFSYENWQEDQPDSAEERCNSGNGPGSNNQRCYEHCVAMEGDGTWIDSQCDVVDGYVCEWEPAGD